MHKIRKIQTNDEKLENMNKSINRYFDFLLDGFCLNRIGCDLRFWWSCNLWFVGKCVGIDGFRGGLECGL